MGAKETGTQWLMRNGSWQLEKDGSLRGDFASIAEPIGEVLEKLDFLLTTAAREGFTRFLEKVADELFRDWEKVKNSAADWNGAERKAKEHRRLMNEAALYLAARGDGSAWAGSLRTRLEKEVKSEA